MGPAAARFDAWLDEQAEGWLSETIELQESARTAALARTPSPAGKGGRNWITADKPGNTGQLPPYLQQVRDGIRKTGKSLGQATAIAISKLRKWAGGVGDVSPEVRAAARKAMAEYEAMRARAKGKA